MGQILIISADVYHQLEHHCKRNDLDMSTWVNGLIKIGLDAIESGEYPTAEIKSRLLKAAVPRSAGEHHVHISRTRAGITK